MEGGSTDVVKAHDGNVLGYAQFRVAQRADGADGGHVVEGEERTESLATGQQLLDDRVAELR